MLALVGRLVVFMGVLIVGALTLAIGLVSLAPRQVAVQKSSMADSGFSLAAPKAQLPSELLTPSAFTAAKTVAEMSLSDKVRSLLIVSLAGTDAESLSGFVSHVGAGGFILMGKNIPSTAPELAAETAALRGKSAFPRFVAIDEEGGEVKRLPYDTFPGANTLRNESSSATSSAFTSRAALLKSVGVNLNFGIVADVSSDPKSFIYGRSFGSDGTSVAERVSAAVSAEKSGSVSSTLKHFPGHGSAAGDSHTSIPASGLDRAQWTASDALPFVAGIKAGAQAVMFGHLSFPGIDETPSSLSRTWHNILRQDLNFHGLAVTDDMTMLQRSKVPELADPSRNAVRALAAGNDLLVYTWGDAPASAGIDVDQLVNGIVAAVRQGEIPEKQITESALRALAVRRTFSPESGSDSKVCSVACILAYSKLGLTRTPTN
jgi:beta-N-acetylhexosaminidase